ncbi:MAG: hypothetical protein ACJA2E_000045 [Arenicella sp.]|jgi:hypothetical protein
MPLDKLDISKPIPIGKAFRHLVFFQIKLIVDALRDLLFSPISLIAFIFDAVVKPPVGQSLSYKLTRLGRKSDRMINLFGEYTASGEFTIDATVNDLESKLLSEINKRKERDGV